MFTFFVVRAAATSNFAPSFGAAPSFAGLGATSGAASGAAPSFTGFPAATTAGFPGAGGVFPGSAAVGSFPAATTAGFPGASFSGAGSSFSTGSAFPAATFSGTSFTGSLPAPSTAPPTLDTRGLPVGTATGIVDSDLLGLNIGNVPWIGNPRLGQNYQTPVSDQLLSSLYSTGQYNTLGGRINTSPFPGQNLGTLNIPFSINNGGLAIGGVTTTTNGGIPLTSQVNNLAFQSPFSTYTPSISNAFLPSSSQFLNANLAPWATAPSSNLPGLGYSSLINPPSAQNGGLPLGYNYGNALALNTLSQPFGTQFGGQFSGLGQTQFSGLGQTQFGGLGLGQTQFSGLGLGGLGAGQSLGLYGGY